MRVRAVELLLAACEECGALQLRDMFVEVALIVGTKEFTSAEIFGHALLPQNRRLRRALEAKLGADFSPWKLGKLFAQYAGVSIAGIVICKIGEEGNAVVWACQSQPERAATDRT